jgi:Glycosyl transferases group 1
VLAGAGFEAAPGSQAALLAECRALAQASGTVLLPALAWREVPEFLAGAAVTVVPSARETFGNLALESLSAGTPVIAHATGNLPALIGPRCGHPRAAESGTGRIAGRSQGPARRAGTLLPGVWSSVLPVTELQLCRSGSDVPEGGALTHDRCSPAACGRLCTADHCPQRGCYRRGRRWRYWHAGRGRTA